ncbi:MAG TPA: leucyl aminopeptidase, partial [Legionellaceae bacterium]|nr:leucyl aminopeptidase [Legionellaceae bacterium]
MHHGLVSSLAQIKSDCLVIGLFTDTQITDLPIHATHHALLAHLKSKLLESGDTIYHSAPDSHAFLLIHCGQKNKYTPSILTDYVFKIAKIITGQHLLSATIALPPLEDHSANWQIQQMIIQFEAQAYQFLDLKTKTNQTHKTKAIEWFLPSAEEEAVHAGEIIADSIRYTRHLANLPANICTPSYLAKQAHILDTEWDPINCKIIDKKGIEELGMGAFLAVAKGSAEPPQLIQLKYHGGGSEPPIVLIGKGVTFDSGGISLKPAEFMEEMKYDMAGAASVLGTLKACAALKLPLNVIGLLACTENMPSGTATKPGDVVTSMSGQTIEITNTDAEGRLILCDALTYAKQFNPRYVIDIATLTGAIIIALGSITTGLMGNDDELIDKILSAGHESQERTWRLPLDNAYQDMLESPV